MPPPGHSDPSQYGDRTEGGLPGPFGPSPVDPEWLDQTLFVPLQICQILRRNSRPTFTDLLLMLSASERVGTERYTNFNIIIIIRGLAVGCQRGRSRSEEGLPQTFVLGLP